MWTDVQAWLRGGSVGGGGGGATAEGGGGRAAAPSGTHGWTPGLAKQLAGGRGQGGCARPFLLLVFFFLRFPLPQIGPHCVVDLTAEEELCSSASLQARRGGRAGRQDAWPQGRRARRPGGSTSQGRPAFCGLMDRRTPSVCSPCGAPPWKAPRRQTARPHALLFLPLPRLRPAGGDQQQRRGVRPDKAAAAGGRPLCIAGELGRGRGAGEARRRGRGSAGGR